MKPPEPWSQGRHEAMRGRALRAARTQAQGDIKDMAWKANRYDWLLTNDDEAKWQVERENIDLRARAESYREALQKIASLPPNLWGNHAQWAKDIARDALSPQELPK